jgi:hypothetical protein
MLKPQRNLVVALLLVAIGLGGAFLSARVFVTSMENRRLAEYQKTQARAASSTGSMTCSRLTRAPGVERLLSLRDRVNAEPAVAPLLHPTGNNSISTQT